MINNHLYSSQQTREPAWKRVMAALGSCAAAPTIVRITAAALAGMSHTHTHSHRSKEIWKHTHTFNREVVQKNVQFQTFAFGGWTPLPLMALFQAVFMPYFLFVIETEFFLIQLRKIIQQNLSHYPTKKLQQLSSSSKIIQFWDSTCTKDTPTSF